MMFGKNVESVHIANRIKENSIGVELGVWKGNSSIQFVKKTKHLHLVDAWAPVVYEESDEHGDYEKYLDRYAELVGSRDEKDFIGYYDKIYETVKNTFKDKPVTIHRMSTDNFFKSFHEKVDWVYVDAAHDYLGCLKDLKNSLKILKNDGIIYGDDYHNKPGVKKAVTEFIKETGLKFDNIYGNQYEIRFNN